MDITQAQTLVHREVRPGAADAGVELRFVVANGCKNWGKSDNPLNQFLVRAHIRTRETEGFIFP